MVRDHSSLADNASRRERLLNALPTANVARLDGMTSEQVVNCIVRRGQRTAESVGDALLELPGELTIEDVQNAMDLVNRIYGPLIVRAVYQAGRLTQETAVVVVPGAWSCAEYPMKSFTRAEWRALFSFAGYTVDGTPAARPSKPLTLYRGAHHSHCRGWSWCDELEVARTFAEDQIRGRLLGQVWVADVEPWRLMAQINDGDEREYVIDTTRLKITALVAERR